MDAVAYIDGFNLYYGSLKGTPDKWLDLQALITAVTPASLTIKQIRYFTAQVKPSATNPTMHTDQLAYLRAIAAHCPNVVTHLGHYSRQKVTAEPVTPPPPKIKIWKNEEKGSDVNLAVHMVHDAYTAGIKAAILISNDSDLECAVTFAQQAGVEVFWFPPTRNARYPSTKLQAVVTHQRGFQSNVFSRCQLPDPIADARGTITKPAGW